MRSTGNLFSYHKLWYVRQLCAYFIVCAFFYILICVHYCIDVVAVVVGINSIQSGLFDC